MKKFLISVCAALFILSAPLSAFEWGGVVRDDTGISTPDFKDLTIKQSNGISLWFNAPLGEGSGFALSGEALYKYLFTIAGEEKTFINIADVPLLKVAGTINTAGGRLSLNAGRFSTADGTGAVLAQTCDGLAISYAMPTLKIGAYAGYTGFVNALNTAMAVAPENDNKIYNMAYKVAPVGASFELPSLFANQSISLQGYALIDLGSNKTNKYFANFILTGPITNSIFYNLCTSVGSENFKTLMDYSAFSLYVFPTSELSITAGVEYGSGEQGKLSPYSSLSVKSADVASKILPKLSVTYGTKSLCLDVGGRYILACNEGKYDGAGAEANLGFVYNIFSDLQVGFNATAFFDTTEAKANNYSANLNIALAF